MSNILSFITFLLLSTLTFAQTYEYELKGSYKLNSSIKKNIAYTLRWSEENGKIQGTYSDNYFAKAAEVSGEGSQIGRTFLVKFPETKKGVQSVTVLSSLVKKSKTATTVPVSFVTRDSVGNPLSTLKGSANFVALTDTSVAQLQEEGCTDGFGVLAGYCGLYAGMLVEQQDRRNRCNLLFADAVRLELTTDGTVILHLGEVNELITTPGHSIGRIPFNPQKNSIDLVSRVCGPVSGVNSSSTSCKQLHLSGKFTTGNEIRHFSGNYTITEEGTNMSCKYSLSMDREQTI